MILNSSIKSNFVTLRSYDMLTPVVLKGSLCDTVDGFMIPHTTPKFSPVSLERPKTRGRPPKFYHLLLQKEKELSSAVQRILPKNIADSVVQKGSRLTQLYGLPKTHIFRCYQPQECIIINLLWLEEKLKPLSVNEHTVSDIFVFANELREMNNWSVLASGLLLGSFMANAFIAKSRKKIW